MKNQDKFENQFKSIIEIFKKGGCTQEDALSFINSNIEFLVNNDIELLKNTYFIYNNKELYSILIVDENDYYWSIYANNKFYPIRNNNNTNEENKDYIIEMIINFANKEVVQRIVPDIKNMDTATKIKTLKKIKLNSEGYHIR